MADRNGSAKALNTFAALVGVRLDPARAELIAAHLAEVAAVAADLDGLDLDAVELGGAFDPRWPEEDR